MVDLIFCCLDRASTRVHAPPGGKSSISFGDYNEPAKKAVNPPANAVPLSAFGFANKAVENDSSLSAYINQDKVQRITNRNTASNGASMSSLINQDSVPAVTARQSSAYGHSSNSSMSDIINQEPQQRSARTDTAHAVSGKASSMSSIINQDATSGGGYTTARAGPHSSDSSIGNMLGGNHAVTTKPAGPVNHHHTLTAPASSANIGGVEYSNSNSNPPTARNNYAPAATSGSGSMSDVLGGAYTHAGNAPTRATGATPAAAQSSMGQILTPSESSAPAPKVHKNNVQSSSTMNDIMCGAAVTEDVRRTTGKGTYNSGKTTINDVTPAVSAPNTGRRGSHQHTGASSIVIG